jgi:hypothetical protein
MRCGNHAGRHRPPSRMLGPVVKGWEPDLEGARAVRTPWRFVSRPQTDAIRLGRRVLMVCVAHGLDLATFLIALSALTIHAEANYLMRGLYVSSGPIGVIALKTAGTAALACMVAQQRWPHLARWTFIPAVSAGILGAEVNLLALSSVNGT